MSNQDFLAYLQGRGQSFNNYAAGKRRYGSGLRDAPNIGPSDPIGYRERDATAAARRNAMLRRLKAAQQGKFMSSAYLSPDSRSY